MLPDEIRRAAKEETSRAEVYDRFKRSRDDMLLTFRGLTAAQKLIELRNLILALGEKL